MKNFGLILGFLLGGFIAARLVGAGPEVAARAALALVFLFTAAGHFAKTEAVAELLPPSIPARRGPFRQGHVLTTTKHEIILLLKSASAGRFLVNWSERLS
jgi:hypothetical protein